MGYYNTDLMKAHLEMLPTDTSIDPVLNNFGDGGDSWVDSFMGNRTPVSPVPSAYKHAASEYGAGQYKIDRLADDVKGKALQESAKTRLMEYKKGIGRVTVFG